MIHLLVAAAVLLFAIQAFAGAGCAPRDFFAIPVPARAESPKIDALRIAYPDLVISSDGAQIAFPGSEWIPLGSRTRGSPQRLLTEPSVVDQFAYVYPLDMGLEERKQPWHDPGRVRNDAFFRARVETGNESWRFKTRA